MKEAVKQLWQLCFNDSEAFLEMYFRLRYNERVNMALQADEKVVSALQLLPYPMTFRGATVETRYVSGTCTHPDYRNRGLMRRLLRQALERTMQEGAMFSTLIPAEPWLFDYYARSGYAPLFKQGKRLYRKPDTPLPAGTPPLQTLHQPAELYAFFRRKLEEKACCVLHDFNDCRVIMADLRLSGGRIFTLKQDEHIVAGALVTPTEDGSWMVGECLSDTPELSEALLQQICDELFADKLLVLQPAAPQGEALGMIRVIDAEAALRLYAAAHPELQQTLCLTDPLLPANNGCYRLQAGTCIKNAKPATEADLAIDIGTLTEMLFEGLTPHISLMLN